MAETAEQEQPVGKDAPTETLDEIKSRIRVDINAAETYFDEEYRDKCDYLSDRYYGIRERNPEIPDWCANLTFNRAFGLVNAETPQNMAGIYQPNQFFSLKALDDKSEGAVKVLQKLMYSIIPEMNFYKQHYWGVTDSLYMPAGWMKWGWKKGEKKKKKYSEEGGKIKTTIKRKKASAPFCQSRNIYEVLFDKENYGIDDVRFIAEKYFVKISDIENDTATYNKSDEVKAFLDLVRAFPIENRPHRVLIYEYWTEDEVAVITENGFLLRYQDNPYDRIPYRPLVKFPDPRKVLGVSSVEAGADILDAQDDLLNVTFDKILLNVHKPMFYTGNLTDADLQTWPGKIIKGRPGDSMQEIQQSPLGNDWINLGVQMDSTLNQVLGNIDQIDSAKIDTATQARQVEARRNSGRRAYIDYNREDYMKWALEFFIELLIDNMKPDEMKKRIGESDFNKLNVLIEDLKFDDISYKILLTGDNEAEDRMTYVQNTDMFLNMLGKIQQFKVAEAQGVMLPINFDLLTQALVNKFNFPEGVYVEESEVTEQKKQPTIEQELQVVAKGRGITPEQLLGEIGAQVGKDAQGVLADIQAAGSFAAYLKTQAQVEGGKV